MKRLSGASPGYIVPSRSLTILGSSSGMPQADRATSGYLLKTGDELSLIDCGGGICSSFLRRGFDPLQVRRVFISHTHADHVIELPLFIQMVYLSGRTEPLDVYLPSEFVRPFRAYLPALYLFPEKLPFLLNLTGYEAGKVFEGTFTLTAIENKHLVGHHELIQRLNLPNRMQCHSMLVEVAGKSLFYSADVGSFDDIKPYLGGRDIVVTETTHLDLDDFLSYMAAIGTGQLVVSHLGSGSEVARINSLANKMGVDNLVAAVDGLELPF
ncbi:MAG: MBL fold metallo-hydrolase [Candidatus Zixiibacteriota bacterium]